MRYDRRFLFAGIALAVIIFFASLALYPAWAADVRALVALAALAIPAGFGFLANFRKAVEKPPEPSQGSQPVIQTGGGPVYEGSINTRGGDFVAGSQENKTFGDVSGSIIADQVVIVSADHLVQTFRPRSGEDFKQAGRAYLTFLFDQYCYLSMRGLGISDRVPLRLPLLDLYIPLRVRLELPRGETWQADVRLAGRQLKQEEQQQMRLSEPQPVLDVLREHNGLILLGDPGAGKSTFLKYLTLQMALGQGQSALGLGDRLPVLIPLAAYANALEKADLRLDDFIADYFCQTCGDLPVGEILSDALRTGNALVLLDGLDEVQNLNLRSTVVERAVAFYHFHRRKGNKFVLTSRIVGYREVRPSADDLVEGTLLDFDDDEIALFIGRWTAALERQAQGKENAISQREAERERTELLLAVQHNQGVRRLAANPLLLTILAVMKRQGVTLPERRVELYDQYVKTMLSVWNRARSLSGRATGPDLDVQQTIRILAPLALWMHEVNPGVGLVKREDLRRKLEELYAAGGVSDPEAKTKHFLTDVRDYTGLLVERGPGEYGFIHLTFEEYLAGVAIALNAQGSPLALLEKILPLAGDASWREILLLAVGYVALIQQLDRVTGQVIETLAGDAEEAEGVILSGEAAADLQSGAIRSEVCQRSRAGLINVMTGSSPVSVRARAGNTLARLGDPRAEVMTVESMPLCFVPGGPFLMGSREEDEQAYDDEKPQHEVTLPDYWIGQYPVTNDQFQEFVEAQGYTCERYWSEAREHGYWSPEGFKGRRDDEPRKQPAYYGGAFDLPNHPVVGVAWYEALAFTRWLQERLPEGWRAALPSEAEWEKAARGGLRIPKAAQVGSPAGLGREVLVDLYENAAPARTYPWGENFTTEHANTGESGVGATSAAGCFANAASPYGAQDMAGNVWEWTRSLNKGYPYNAQDGREELTSDDGLVLRGGSWYYIERFARCSFRLRLVPLNFYYYIGFRVVVLPILRSDL